MHCPSPSYSELHSPSHGPRTGVGQSFREYNAVFLRTVGEGSSGLLHFETDTTFILLRRLQMRLKNLKPSVGRLRHILLLVTTQTQVKLARTKCVPSAKSDRLQTHVSGTCKTIEYATAAALRCQHPGQPNKHFGSRAHVSWQLTWRVVNPNASDSFEFLQLTAKTSKFRSVLRWVCLGSEPSAAAISNTMSKRVCRIGLFKCMQYTSRSHSRLKLTAVLLWNCKPDALRDSILTFQDFNVGLHESES